MHVPAGPAICESHPLSANKKERSELQSMHAAAGGGIPPLSAAVLERHGRGNLGLPPLPQVRLPPQNVGL